MAQLILGVGFGVFLQKIAKQVIVGVDVRVLFQPLGPVCLKGRLGLDVRNTAHPGVYTKAKIIVLIQFLVQILFARHTQLIADRLLRRNLHLDTGVAVAVLFAGHHTDLQRVSSGGDRLKKRQSVLQLHQRIAGENRSGRKMDGADIQRIHPHISNHFFCEMGLQISFAGQLVLDRFVFVPPLGGRYIGLSFQFRLHPDDGPVKVIVTIQFLVLLHFRLAVW